MKTEDFERLKAVCEKEGFEVGIDPFFNHLFKVKKKDIWDGVEFVNLSNIIFKVLSIDKTIVNLIPSGWTTIRDCKPSTESEYVEQLKKEAFDRFGEIQDGDRFDCSSMGKGTCPITFKQGECEWVYIKEDDRFRKGYFDLYQQGKWATKVKERVILPCHVIEYLRQYLNRELSYNQIEHLEGSGTRVKAEFLAQQLEKYLNEEL